MLTHKRFVLFFITANGYFQNIFKSEESFSVMSMHDEQIQRYIGSYLHHLSTQMNPLWLSGSSQHLGLSVRKVFNQRAVMILCLSATWLFCFLLSFCLGPSGLCVCVCGRVWLEGVSRSRRPSWRRLSCAPSVHQLGLSQPALSTLPHQIVSTTCGNLIAILKRFFPF